MSNNINFAEGTQKTSNQNGCMHYEWRLNLPMDREIIKETLRTYCDKWVFQEEKGEQSGIFHYQGRLKLKEKMRPNQVVAIFREIYPTGSLYVGLTASCNTKDFNYVSKTATRVNGPWSYSDFVMHKLPEYYQEEHDWHPWQRAIDKSAENPDDRCIDVLVDQDEIFGGQLIKSGNIGKTNFCNHRCIRMQAVRLMPYYDDPRHLVRTAWQKLDQFAKAKLPPPKLFFLDLPKAVEKKQMRIWFQALEQIKSGYTCEDRYGFKEAWMNPPAIWVFSNELPDRNLLSEDRWRIWKVNRQTMSLVPYHTPIEPGQYPAFVGDLPKLRLKIIPTTDTQTIIPNIPTPTRARASPVDFVPVLPIKDGPLQNLS
nr:MAG: replication associated protein [Arizlama virus]